MYPIEWYMKLLKKFVCNKEKLEGSMCEGYLMQYAIGFYTKCMKYFSTINWCVWDNDEGEKFGGEVLEVNGHLFKLWNEERTMIHAYVIQNTSTFDKWCNSIFFSHDNLSV